jgi:hypothetical protein
VDPHAGAQTYRFIKIFSREHGSSNDTEDWWKYKQKSVAARFGRTEEAEKKKKLGRSLF